MLDRYNSSDIGDLCFLANHATVYGTSGVLLLVCFKAIFKSIA